MIDIATEEILTISQAARLAKISFTACWRWITVGMQAPGGGKVRLRAAKLGHRWITSTQALQEFMAALTPPIENGVPSPLPRTPTKRRLESEKAAAELSRLGI